MTVAYGGAMITDMSVYMGPYTLKLMQTLYMHNIKLSVYKTRAMLTAY